MSKYVLNVTTVQQGHKMQLVKEVREIWGEERTKPGEKIVFYEDDDGNIIIEPAGRPED
ncbi:hypothetical protein [Haloferax sp. CBA1150]|uniref:Uncharacterized protein n=1 Tax=Haloferax marinum TaxID=2666143 RepID=A0A6A8G8E7_9EURY|nr:hypothetical protein [Haloferax sp. CBA1150]MRW97540.1 hypothetical protein [Haloferax marinum]